MEWWGSIMARYSPYVQDYLDRVTAADVAAGNTQGLEPGVADGFSVAIEGLVASAMLGVSGGVISQAASKIKAMCFMCGARTLSGCLVPVVGPAPTNFNFTEPRYNRKTGLLGDGVSMYLNSNRNNNVDPQDNKHIAVFSVGSWSPIVALGCGPATNELGATNIGFTGTSAFARITARVSPNTFGPSSFSGFLGASRSIAGQYQARCNALTTIIGNVSITPFAGDLFIFSTTGGALPSSARLSFYSIGESLDLAVLDARISTLMATLATVIP
jgi:hypothetical protein